MTKEELFTQLSEIQDQFNSELWGKIVDLIDNYTKENGYLSDYYLQHSPAEKLSENLIFSGAWIVDRLRDLSGVPDCHGYKKSLTKKVRKSMGYTL